MLGESSEEDYEYDNADQWETKPRRRISGPSPILLLVIVLVLVIASLILARVVHVRSTPTGSNRAPSTGTLSIPSQRSSTVA